MSSPIEKYKAELQAMLKFDEKAAFESFKKFAMENAPDKGAWFAQEYIAGMKSQHTKTAKIAQALLDAVEALEFVVNREDLSFAECAVAEELWSKCKTVLEKLSKGDE